MTIKTVTQGGPNGDERQTIFHDSATGSFKLKFDRHVVKIPVGATAIKVKDELSKLKDAQGRKVVVA